MRGSIIVLRLRLQPCCRRGLSCGQVRVVHLAIVSFRYRTAASCFSGSFLSLASLVTAGKRGVAHALWGMRGEVGDIQLQQGGSHQGQSDVRICQPFVRHVRQSSKHKGRVKSQALALDPSPLFAISSRDLRIVSLWTARDVICLCLIGR